MHDRRPKCEKTAEPQPGVCAGRGPKRILRRAALLLAVLLTFGRLTGAAQAETWRDAEIGFTLTYPDGWRIEGGADGTDRYFAAYSPSGEAGLAVRAARLLAGTTLSVLRQVYEQSRLSGGTVVGENPTRLGGQPAIRVVYRIAANGRSLAVAAVYGKVGDLGYVLTTIAPEAGAGNDRAAAEAALASLHLPGEPALPSQHAQRPAGDVVSLASGARITAPPGWSARPENGTDGEGALMMMSPDERAAIGLNILRMAPGAPLGVYVAAVESQAFAGAVMVEESARSLNGLQGSMRAYDWRQGDTNINARAFFAERAGFFITLWSTVEASAAGLHQEAVAAAMQSFQVQGAGHGGGVADGPARLVSFAVGAALKSRFDIERAQEVFMASDPQIVAAFKLDGGAGPVRLSLCYGADERVVFEHDLAPEPTGRYGLREGVMTYDAPTRGWPVGFYKARLEFADGRRFQREFMVLPAGDVR